LERRNPDLTARLADWHGEHSPDVIQFQHLTAEEGTMSNASGVIARRELSAEEIATKTRLEAKGSEALDEEDYKLALECYHKLTILDGANPEPWNMIGVCFANLEFPREAWRSYMLALSADPENLDALWYASEFLINMEDFDLARLILSRYIELETDEERLEEAREELDQVNRQLGDKRSSRKSATISVEDDEIEDLEMVIEDDPEIPDGYAVDEVEDDLSDFEEDEDEDDFEDLDADEFEDDDNTGMSEEEEETFVASVTLQLTGVALSCRNCGTALPVDAPYCFGCKSICFYED
jgi:tetratricopeptide (TPR) repeat protein